MSNNNKKLSRFVYDPNYRLKVIARVHKEDDLLYQRRLSTIRAEINKLEMWRNQEISRLVNSRWEIILPNKLLINRTEGKISINQTTHYFSSIKGAEANAIYGYRSVTKQTGNARKKGSLGGAVAGGLVAGAYGAVVGGVGLGKTQITTNSVTNQIPICTHLGVMINIDGFTSEVIIFSGQIDVASRQFSNIQAQAQSIISLLSSLAATPVPVAYLKPEEETSVKSIDQQIATKQTELQQAIANTPTYRIPEMYRLPEQRNLSDEEYLQYLAASDVLRASNQTSKEISPSSITPSLQNASTTVIPNTITISNTDRPRSVFKKILNVAWHIIFWHLSLFVLLFSIIVLSSDGGILGGLTFLSTAIVSNPLIACLVDKYLFRFPKWVTCIILPVGSFIGLIVFALCLPPA